MPGDPSRTTETAFMKTEIPYISGNANKPISLAFSYAEKKTINTDSSMNILMGSNKYMQLKLQ